MKTLLSFKAFHVNLHGLLQTYEIVVLLIVMKRNTTTYTVTMMNKQGVE